MIQYNKNKMAHLIKYRQMVSKPIFTKVITSLQNKIMKVGGLKPAALPFINQALWDSNPPVMYSSDYNEGSLDLTNEVTANFFSALAEKINKMNQ